MSESNRRTLKGGTVWTPEGWLADATVLIEDGRIAGLYEGASDVLPHRVEAVDVRGQYVLPGLIDTHSHHREPGFSHKENVRSATRAAAVGASRSPWGCPTWSLRSQRLSVTGSS